MVELIKKPIFELDRASLKMDSGTRLSIGEWSLRGHLPEPYTVYWSLPEWGLLIDQALFSRRFRIALLTISVLSWAPSFALTWWWGSWLPWLRWAAEFGYLFEQISRPWDLWFPEGSHTTWFQLLICSFLIEYFWVKLSVKLFLHICEEWKIDVVDFLKVKSKKRLIEELKFRFLKVLMFNSWD